MRISRAITTGFLTLGLAAGLVTAMPNNSYADEVLLADDVLLANENDEVLNEVPMVEPERFDVEYVDDHSDQKVAQGCLAIDATTTELKEGWYVLSGNVELNEALFVEGDVRIIFTQSNQLVAKQGIRVKKDSKLTVYTQKDASATMLVRKGIIRELTKDQQTEEAQRIAKLREADPAYHEDPPQILFVWPCLEVTAGDNEPSNDPEHVFDPEHDPKQIEKPVLGPELLKRDYLVIRPHAAHDLMKQDDAVLIEDGHVTCTRCDGWFEDLECHVPTTKVVEELQEPQVAQVQAEAGDSEASTTSSDGNSVVTVTFDPNGGSGSMDSMQVTAGESFVLPECAYTPPSGMEFSQWSLGKPGASVSVPSSITVRAWWKQASSSSDDQQSSQTTQQNVTQNMASQTTTQNTTQNQSTQTTSSGSPDTGDETTLSSDIAGVLVVCGLVLVLFGKVRLMIG